MARLKTLAPRLAFACQAIAEAVPKQADPYYSSSEWRALREARLALDGHRCTHPGCDARAIVVDHVVSRRNGGSDDLQCLRSLCRTHDNRFKEDHTGRRRGGGGVRGFGEDDQFSPATGHTPTRRFSRCRGSFD